MTELPGMRQRGQAVVEQHLDAENRLDFDAALATFAHPRYEIVATDQVHDGANEVRAYYATTRAAFPDQRNEVRAIRHADDAVIVEFDLLGTHRGPLLRFEPTGREFRVPMIAIFIFDGELVSCERVYFDSATLLCQLDLPSPAAS